MKAVRGRDQQKKEARTRIEKNKKTHTKKNQGQNRRRKRRNKGPKVKKCQKLKHVFFFKRAQRGAGPKNEFFSRKSLVWKS